jgi:5-methylcytosine-specific restriction endonuclease McrA
MAKKSLTKKLDKLCSEIVRSKGVCERCGSVKSLQCCHIFSRTYRSTRWDLDNLICMCAKCHFWSHKNPTLFTDWVYETRGQQYLILKEKFREITKLSEDDLQIAYEVLKEINEGNIKG